MSRIVIALGLAAAVVSGGALAFLRTDFVANNLCAYAVATIEEATAAQVKVARCSVDPAVVSAFTHHHRDRATVAGFLETARRLIPELREPFELHRIATPLLLVWGDRDRLTSHRGAERVLDAVPAARLELLEVIGHCP